MGDLSTIRNQALTERVEERLLQYILDEGLPVGTKLPNEYQLASLFGVGRGTIRESVKSLVSRGVLRVRHGSGTYVASVSPAGKDTLGLEAIENKLQLALDLTELRLILEPDIAAMAALKRTEEEARQLAECCAAVQRKIEAGEDYIKEDMAFHSHIAACSHNMAVQALMPMIETAVVSIANVTRRALLTATIETHGQLVDYITQRDPVGARTAMAMHLTLNRNHICREYQKSREGRPEGESQSS